jgi:hypothetical protein
MYTYKYTSLFCKKIKIRIPIAFLLSTRDYHNENITFYVVSTALVLTSNSFLTSLRSCNGHAPLIIQEGRARTGHRVPCATPNSSKALGMWGGGVAKCLSRSRIRTRVPHSLILQVFFVFFLLFSVFSPPRFPTSLRSCNGHAPLISQEGRARAGQKVQPRRVRQNSALDSSLALGKGGGGRDEVSLRARSRT